jgi:hypothetical protein
VLRYRCSRARPRAGLAGRYRRPMVFIAGFASLPCLLPPGSRPARPRPHSGRDQEQRRQRTGGWSYRVPGALNPQMKRVANAVARIAAVHPAQRSAADHGRSGAQGKGITTVRGFMPSLGKSISAASNISVRVPLLVSSVEVSCTARVSKTGLPLMRSRSSKATWCW